MVQVRTLVPRPVNPVVERPVRLAAAPAVMASLKTTWTPVICHGRSNRDEPITLYDRDPNSTRYSLTVGATPSMTMALLLASDPAVAPTGTVRTAEFGLLVTTSAIVPASAAADAASR